MGYHTIIYIFFTFYSFTIGYNINTDAISVSGLSAGGFMAVQFHIAYSSHVNGSGIFAGGPFYCAQNQISTALSACMYAPSLLDINKLVQLTAQFVKDKKIDDTSNIKNHKVYLFSGKKDYTVNPEVMHKLQEYYSKYTSNIKAEFNFDASHTFPTLNYGTDCTISAPPYIGKCNYDGAGIVLNNIFSNLRPKKSAISSNIKSVRQSDFFPSGTIGMGNTAYYYLPTECANNRTLCSLHVSFHGCLQDPQNVQDKFYTSTGYNDWAEANNIIILYPQSVAVTTKNPNACFDWWGYGSADYAFKTSPQMTTVWNMIKYLAN